MANGRPTHAAVKWLLAAGLLRKLLAIAKSYLANELDLRDWMSQSAIADFRQGRDEVWFDYIADTGDDPLVMQTLAKHLVSAHAADSLGAKHPALERGAFLFVGGDTAYHVADESTIRERFVEPFNRAIGDTKPEVRPVYAIPGNHDYYDNLVGFNRVFRKSYPEGQPSVLLLRSFAPKQEASYIKVLLPGAWELWGADIGPHGLDYRQHEYFTSGARPKQLILCTPTPPVSFNRVLVNAKATDPEREAYTKLIGHDPAFTPDAGGRPLAPDECRLHLAGDDHHYARYSGHRDPSDAARNLATIVSGGGGAFTHPTEFSNGTLACAIKYPDPETSRTAVARALTSPLTMIRAGMLHVVGILLALLLLHTWPTDLRQLHDPAIWLGCLTVSICVIAGGARLTKWLAMQRKKQAKAQRRRTAPDAAPPAGFFTRFTVFIVPVAVIVALAAPVVTSELIGASRPFGLHTIWLVATAVLAIAMTALAWVRGGTNCQRTTGKAGFGVLGAFHAVFQIVLPYELATGAGILAPLVVLGTWLAFGWPGRAMYRRVPALVLTVLWLAQGLGAIALSYFHPWTLPFAVPAWSVWGLAVAIGFVVTPMQFGFYILTAAAWNGHNNEAGISTRMTACKEWIRFRVTQHQLEGYVIGIDDPTQTDARVRLIDRFVIAPAAK